MTGEERDRIDEDIAVADDALAEAAGSLREGQLREHAERIHLGVLGKVGGNDAQRVLVEAYSTRKLPHERRKVIATGARAVLSRRWLYYFFRYSWHVLEPDTPLEINWHHKLLCDHVQGQLDDWKKKKRDPKYKIRAQNAAYNFAPGTTKSRVISVSAPAWMWIDFPTWNVLCLSANPFVATRDAMFARDIVTSEWYRRSFNITWTIREDVDAKGNYRNTAGGSRVSLGITSRVVGARADCIIIDDANDMFEVFSEAKRREVNGKIDHAIWNRVNDQRACIRMEMQQRGHIDDATGHLTRKLGTVPSRGGIMHVPVPMEYDPTLKVETPYGYKDPRKRPGESLHPVRFTKEFLAAERVRLGSFGFESQYNQKPAPVEGNMFKRPWFRFFRPASNRADVVLPDRPPGCLKRADHPAIELRERANVSGTDAHWTQRLDLDWWCISVDCSFGSTSQSASQVGIGVIAGKQALRYIFDDRTKVRDFDDTCKVIEDLLKAYPAVRRVLVENKANGPAVINVMRKRFPGFIGLEPEGGKTARANAMVPAVESGNVLLLDGAPWVADFVEEICLFDRGPYDDRVDMLSQLMTYAEKGLAVASAWDAMSR